MTNTNNSDAEIASGIICGCMPVLPQFFRNFLPKLTSTFVNSSAPYSRRSGHSAALKVVKLSAADSASRSGGRKHHLSSNSVTGEPVTVPWDDDDNDDDGRELHTEDRGDVEEGINLQSLQEARARRRRSSASEQDDRICYDQ